ncbi:GNAT family N-acetyltransferase [Catenovulum sp. 2E275]|uniref:tRNA(Met) cytidine acetyltransferase TmcA n=1 Tax=Catenovulum sp. 2E275 TaxID=2980497 RepID=UPI0021D2A251|nr:GNAT family N-acetyltransferase [Catenovulum sp. 2E275]MCU4674839.1 GNAT family N-acetyltransferase [Catenovulum sp. 2E275]
MDLALIMPDIEISPAVYQLPLAQLNQHGWRLPVVIAGEPNWRGNQANAILQLLTGKNGLAFNSEFGSNLKHYQQYLGQEFDFVWIDSQSGLNPDAIAALSGTIKAGGLLILTVSAQVLTDDPDMQRFLPWQSAQTHNHSYFNQRLLQLNQQLNLGCYFSQQTISTVQAQNQLYQIAPNTPSWRQITELTCEQTQIIEAICQNQQGHFIITADRGRGKSATLGAIAAQLNHPKSCRIIITAPAKNCVQTAQLWYQKRIENHNAMSFYAPDYLLLNQPETDVLIIDEAAAIPAQILQQLAKIYPFIIYATTEHGYEGSGKGFSQKFINQLKSAKYTLAEFRLTQPIRWAEHDPLENWLNQIYLLNAEPTEVSSVTTTKIEWLNKSQLSQNEPQLTALFGLLIQAHYRTTPSDLRYLLDSPAMQVAVMKNQADQIIAACIVSDEGPLPDELANDCMQGKRRPNGHLTPQLIAAQTGHTEFARLKGWRIVRIAVSPKWQQQNLGSVLIKWLEQQAQNKQLDYVSTSFSTHAKLLSFWQKNQFQLVRCGLTAETNTGLFSSLMIMPLNSTSQSICSLLSKQNKQQLNYLLPTLYQHLDCDVIWNWLSILNNTSDIVPNDSYLAAFMDGFANAHTNYFSAQPVLANYCLAHPEIILQNLSQSERALLCRALLSQWPVTKICKQFKLSGKKALINQLRSLFYRLIK